MGDGSNFTDIERFMRSPEGQARLHSIRRRLVGQSIGTVEFSNGTRTIEVVLRFADDSSFRCQLPELDVDALRAGFQLVLDREYYKDFPER